MTTSVGSVTRVVDKICPTAMRGLFNYLAVDWRARTEPGEITVRSKRFGLSSEVVEYFDAHGRFALAQRKHGIDAQWDPKNFWFDHAEWRAFQDFDGHRCRFCVLAANRGARC